MLKRPALAQHVMKNVYFDTCVYHQPGIDLLVEVIDIDNILFGSEMVGAVRGIDPQTGHNFDDTIDDDGFYPQRRLEFDLVERVQIRGIAHGDIKSLPSLQQRQDAMLR
jgi:hypothetical protein